MTTMRTRRAGTYRARAIAAAVAAVITLQPASPVFAGDVTTLASSQGATVSVSSAGSGEHANHGSASGHDSSDDGSSSGWHCVERGPVSPSDLQSLGPYLTSFPPEDWPRLVWLVCTNEGTSQSWATVGLAGQPAPTETGSELAQRAVAQLALPEPDITTAPPRHGTQLAGVDVWFWATNVHPDAATATIPGLSATVTATPTTLTIDADGHRLTTCHAPGTPYRREPTESACTWTFQTAATHHIRATATWTITWEATDGTHGSLDPIERTTTFPLTIDDAYAITD